MEHPKKIIITGPIGLAMQTALRAAGIGLLSPSQPHRAGPMAVAIASGAASLSQALLHLNVPTQLIAKVGADPLGTLLHSLLENTASGLADDLVIDPSASTAYQMVIQPADGEPILLGTNSANDNFYASDLPRGVLQAADLFLFCDPLGMRSVYRGEGGELVSIFNKARRAGMTTGLVLIDPSINSPVQPVDWKSMLKGVDLLLVDLVLLSQMLGLADEKINEADDLTARLNSALTGLLEGGPKLALVHAAGRGLSLRTAAESAWQKGGRALAEIDRVWFGVDRWHPLVETGGDAQISSILAGFIAGLVGGESPEETLSRQGRQMNKYDGSSSTSTS